MDKIEKLKKYAEFCKVMDEVLSETDDMTEFNEIDTIVDDDTLPDASGLTTYYQNRYGESYDDCMTGDISKSSRTDTNKDIMV